MSAGRAGQQQQQQHLSAAGGGHSDLALLSDELRMRIVENARLAMQLADQTGDQQRLADRCGELERRSSRQQAEHAELERRLRADLDVMCGRAAELERRLSSSGNNINSGSAACSEDTLSVSDDRELSSTAATGNGDATAAAANASLSSEASLAAGVVVQQLQRELFQARTQLEFAAVRCSSAWRPAAVCRARDCHGEQDCSGGEGEALAECPRRQHGVGMQVDDLPMPQRTLHSGELGV